MASVIGGTKQCCGKGAMCITKVGWGQCVKRQSDIGSDLFALQHRPTGTWKSKPFHTK